MQRQSQIPLPTQLYHKHTEHTPSQADDAVPYVCVKCKSLVRLRPRDTVKCGACNSMAGVEVDRPVGWAYYRCA
jgi:hypothetical protein